MLEREIESLTESLIKSLFKCLNKSLMESLIESFIKSLRESILFEKKDLRSHGMLRIVPIIFLTQIHFAIRCSGAQTTSSCSFIGKKRFFTFSFNTF